MTSYYFAFLWLPVRLNIFLCDYSTLVFFFHEFLIYVFYPLHTQNYALNIFIFKILKIKKKNKILKIFK